MALLTLFCLSVSISDSDPLVTQELVDSINNDPRSSFKATLYPKFAKMTVGDAKKFLSPVRRSANNKGSAVPVGANENFFNPLDRQVVTGISQLKQYGSDGTHKFAFSSPPANYYEWLQFPVYDASMLCSSWAPAVTSAMSISVSRWNTRFVNYSLQFVLDCDLLGDACIERTPLSAYRLFWKTSIPQYSQWDRAEAGYSERTHPMHAPRAGLDLTANGRCLSRNGMYPGMTASVRDWALTGSCEPGDPETNCPVYFLYNWRWIKSHLWEVGAVTSSVLVTPAFFTYNTGVYTMVTGESVIGMLDVTIFGWGQERVNLSVDSASHTTTKNRWWWVIPHLGCDFGLDVSQINATDTFTNTSIFYGLGVGAGNFKTTGSNCSSQTKGIMKFNRRFDDSNIESHAVGAVPFNFVPLPVRTPQITSG